MMKNSAPDNSNPSDTVTIIRYPNRRLYDRNQSKYVTMKDIEEMIHQGQNVQVIDSKSGEELTQSLLTQILMDQHPERMTLFPVPMLHWMIRANDMALESLRIYLHQSLNFLQGWQSFPFNPLAASTEWMKAFFPAPTPPSPPEYVPEEGQTNEVEQRLAELERRLAELQQMAPSSSETDSETDLTAEESAKKKTTRKKRKEG